MNRNMFLPGFSPPYMLRVSARTWMRDSHDLFDYETHQQIKTSHFATSCPLKVLRSESDVSVIEFNGAVEREHDHLLSVVCKRTGEYVVMPAEKMPGSLLYPQKLWLIVRTLPYQRYALQENDVIKLGRFRLRVKQLVPGPAGEAREGPEGVQNGCGSDSQVVKLFDGFIPEKNVGFEEQCSMQCRICLSEGYLQAPSVEGSPVHSASEDTSLDLDTGSGNLNSNSNSPVSSLEQISSPVNAVSGSPFESDRLICACECKGSIKWVHVECLRRWIDSRWNLRSDGPLPPIVFIREVSCELCKTNYPCFIRQNGELIQIVRMPKMQTPFLVLENVTPQAVRGVHLVSMRDSKDLKLGRGHESDLRIPDVSISRYHANIRYEQGNFYLEDHDSKFGTLVAMRRPKLISLNEPLSVQVGRSVINLCVDESIPYLQGTFLSLSPNPCTLESFEASSSVDASQVGNLGFSGQTQGLNVRPAGLDLTDVPLSTGYLFPNPVHLNITTTPTSLVTVQQSSNSCNSPGSGPQPQPPSPSPSARVATMNDLYWSYVRNAARQRYEPDSFDSFSENRLSPGSSSSLVPPNPGNSANLGQNPLGNGGEDLDMLLPESVFIANWNNLPTRNVDLNVDTSTSALEHRHAQDVDKRITRL